MQIKGTAVLSRKRFITARHGESGWESVVNRFRGSIKFLNEPILPTTLLPVDAYLQLDRGLKDMFYRGMSDLEFNEMVAAETATWSLTDGPYKAYMQNKDAKGFVKMMPLVVQSFFVGTECTAELRDEAVRLTVNKVDPYDTYFERACTGYFKQVFQMLGKPRVECKRISSNARTHSFVYDFILN